MCIHVHVSTVDIPCYFRGKNKTDRRSIMKPNDKLSLGPSRLI